MLWKCWSCIQGFKLYSFPYPLTRSDYHYARWNWTKVDLLYFFFCKWWICTGPSNLFHYPMQFNGSQMIHYKPSVYIVELKKYACRRFCEFRNNMSVSQAKIFCRKNLLLFSRNSTSLILPCWTTKFFIHKWQLNFQLM